MRLDLAVASAAWKACTFAALGLLGEEGRDEDIMTILHLCKSKLFFQSMEEGYIPEIAEGDVGLSPLQYSLLDHYKFL